MTIQQLQYILEVKRSGSAETLMKTAVELLRKNQV